MQALRRSVSQAVRRIGSMPEDIALPIMSLDGKSHGHVNVDPWVFNAELRQDIVHRCVIYFQDRRRKGMWKVKTLNELSGSGRKPHPQKGTGRARAGHRRQPQARGGYKPHGPVLRSWDTDLPKKIRKMALRVVLSAKAAQGNLIVVPNFELPSMRTKDAAEALRNLDAMHCFAIDGYEKTASFARATQSLAYVDHAAQFRANAYDVLKRRKTLIALSALPYLEDYARPELPPQLQWTPSRDPPAEMLALQREMQAAKEDEV